ncbi:hypothetical protein FQA39_LY17557 [Lamprigera yunnana]|nr:hypothetical protein FQA39_LY17557 [Lamprigera yunnana]
MARDGQGRIEIIIVDLCQNYYWTKMEHSIKRINSDNETDSLVNKHFQTNTGKGFVEVGESKFCLSAYYEEYRNELENFQVRDSDVYLVAHPKTGTTWVQEMIWLIVNDLNYERAKAQKNYIRFPNLDSALHREDSKLLAGMDFMEYLNQLPDPRCIRTHLPWSLLPKQIRDGTKKPKIITVIRSAEDVCVSYYHHFKLMNAYTGSFDEFCQLFLAGRVCYGPFWKSVLDIWQHRHASNVHFITYADMKNDLVGAIKDCAKFLERDLSENAVEKLEKHLNFDSMRQNPAVNMMGIVENISKKNNVPIDGRHFFRKGIVGSHKLEMTEVQIERFKKWTQDSLEGTAMDIEKLGT